MDRVQQVIESYSTGGERSCKHDHYLKNTLYCADCGSRLYYIVAKNRFGYSRCVGRNNRRTKCNSSYTPVAELEQAIEDVYDSIKLPPGFERRSRGG